MLVGEGCPRTLGQAEDVGKQPGIPSDRLLPTGQPSAGLICEYMASPSGQATALLHEVRLDSTNAQRLANAIVHVSLRPATGSFHCPANFFGSDTVIAFTYTPTLSADLWYRTSGCRTLDNGDVSAFEGANPSFYTGFANIFNSLVPAPGP